MFIYFGAGGGGVAYTKHSGRLPDFFIDNDSSKWGQELLGVSVYAPSILLSFSEEKVRSITKIVITSGYYRSILPQLKEMGMPAEKIEIPPKSWLGSHPFTNLSNRIEVTRFLSDLQSLPEVAIVAVGGTALGFCRDKDFIRWDFDVDLFASTSSYDKLFSFLQKNNCAPSREHQSIKANLALSSGEKVSISFDFFNSNESIYIDRYEEYVWEWPVSMFSEPRVVNVHGYDMRVPNPPEVYLEGIYGKDWRTPRPEFNYSDYGGQICDVET
jgi:hypothetical protein